MSNHASRLLPLLPLAVTITALPACTDIEIVDDAEITVTRQASVDLQGIDLQGIDLQGIDLQGIDLQGIDLQGIDLQGIDLQGIYLYKTQLRGYRYTKLTTRQKRYPYKYKTYNWTGSRWSYSGTVYEGLEGTTFTAQASDGSDVTLKIAAIEQDTDSSNTMERYSSNDDIWLYRLQVRRPTLKGYTWRDICPGDHYGTFFEGSWDDQGDFHDSDAFTFACTSGVLVKCARQWGYKPWATVYDDDSRRHGPDRMRIFHQACTRAARADYCGEGVSSTRNGTAIDLYDNFGLNKSHPEDAAHGMASFEAWIGQHNAYALSRTRYEDIQEPALNCTSAEGGFSLSDHQDYENDVMPSQPYIQDPDRAYADRSVSMYIETTTYCSHNTCQTGEKLNYDCNNCTRSVCDADPYCCDVKWDAICIGEVYQYCPTQLCSNQMP